MVAVHTDLFPRDPDDRAFVEDILRRQPEIMVFVNKAAERAKDFVRDPLVIRAGQIHR